MDKPLNFQKLKKGDTFARLGELLTGDNVNHWDADQFTFSYSAIIPVNDETDYLVASVGFLDNASVVNETVEASVVKDAKVLVTMQFDIEVFTVAYLQDMMTIAKQIMIED